MVCSSNHSFSSMPFQVEEAELQVAEVKCGSQGHEFARATVHTAATYPWSFAQHRGAFRLVQEAESLHHLCKINAMSSQYVQAMNSPTNCNWIKSPGDLSGLPRTPVVPFGKSTVSSSSMIQSPVRTCCRFNSWSCEGTMSSSTQTILDHNRRNDCRGQHISRWQLPLSVHTTMRNLYEHGLDVHYSGRHRKIEDSDDCALWHQLQLASSYCQVPL